MNSEPILVVEDDPVIRELLLDLLDIEGYHAVGAADGWAALRQVERRVPALILLDLNLPALDGEGFLRELQRTEAYPPVLLITADPRGRRLRHVRGIMGFLAKPFDVDDLLSTIRRVLSSAGQREMG